MRASQPTTTGNSPVLVLLALLLCAAWSGTATAAAPRHATPEAAVAALWRALSNAPGASADTATLQALFDPAAQVHGIGPDGLRSRSAADFVAAQSKVSATGFYECEIARHLHVHDRYALAWSVVESRTEDHPDAPVTAIGVNGIQLHRSAQGWKILSLAYELQGENGPQIALDGAVSGRCLGAGQGGR